MVLYIIIAASLIYAIASVALLFVVKRKSQIHVSELAAVQKYSEIQNAEKTEEVKRLNVLLEEKTGMITNLCADLAKAESMIEAMRQQSERDKEELQKIQASFRIEFRNLANEILEEKTTQFKQTNKDAVESLMKPFKDNIAEFKERVEKIYSEENVQRGALQNEIRNLMELNRRITEETNNLTNALKGNSKVQGDWGEMILQTILDNSHLIKGVHYTLQQNIKDADGNNLRPDVILNLPENKKIIIDSKVSLTAYSNFMSEEDPIVRDRHLKDHLVSVKRHVDELGNKGYQESVLGSPDFVIMFVPNEPAFMCALQNDNSIWNEAYRRKVIVSSPTNLFALLKLVDDLWKRDSQNKNAMLIAKEGAGLYEKLVNFVMSLEAVGKNIRTAQDNYDKAYNQLKEGKGSLVKRAEKLKKLGIKPSKNLPDNILSVIEDDDYDNIISSEAEENSAEI